MATINIDGHAIEYELRGPYINFPNAEVIRFYNPEGKGSEPLDAMTCRMEGETDSDMVARVFNCIRMA